MGPVNALGVAEWAADQTVHRDAVELALDVPEGEFDSGYGHGGRAAGRGAGTTVHIHVELVHRERVLAYEGFAEVFYQTGQAAGQGALSVFGVAGYALVGADGAE